MNRICVVGAGLAGCELSYQLSKSNLKIDLYEARLDEKYSDGVHRTKFFSELVCSNSFRSDEIHTASGLLKEELRILNSFILKVADDNKILAGTSLSVSREDFSKAVTDAIYKNKSINVISEEVGSLAELKSKYEVIIIASGPLSSSKLVDSLLEIIDEKFLYFYDAIAPIISKSSFDMNICFYANRYEDGAHDYLNIPLNKEEYYLFVENILKAEKVTVSDGDKEIFFEGCMPIEVMAERGLDTLRHGPMRANGLFDPNKSNKPYAVIQFRKEANNGLMFNMVGFQTRLKYYEQDRIFKTLPGLKNVEFYRYGSMHRNTFLNAPSVLNSDMSLKAEHNIFIAGQLSGVEGYIESVAHGFMVGEFVKKRLNIIDEVKISKFTAIYSLVNYLINADSKNFQPMKINFGIIPEIELNMGKDKKFKKEAVVKRSLESFYLNSLF